MRWREDDEYTHIEDDLRNGAFAMDEATIKRWQLQTWIVCRCVTCFCMHQMRDVIPSEETVIEECMHYGWELREDGPICERCKTVEKEHSK